MEKIFGIGLSKTGTTSLAKAMQVLGYRSQHFLTNPGFEIDNNDFVNDMPIQTRYPEYDKQYPGSKFILTWREKSSWLQSCSKQYHCAGDTTRLRYAYRIEQFGSGTYDEALFSQAYDKHLENARYYFKDRARDLLVLDICGGQGWRELCSFLGEEVPDEPFPKHNVSRDATP